jgi:PDDEXK-like domain of unknown function (DUF3799)
MKQLNQLMNELNEQFVANNRIPNETVIGNWLSLNGVTTHTGADDEYRKLKAYSNSRLSEIKNLLMGMEQPKPLKAFSMGSILHQLILEPELAEAEDYVFLSPAPRRHLKAAMQAVLRNRLLRRVLRSEEAEREQVIQWTDKVTGLPCKAKVDIAYRDHRGRHIIDLKSTGERTREAFLRSCAQYEYERQAAFYLDGSGAESFTIYGVQKVAPYRVFRKGYTRRELEIGRWKYRFILGKVVELEGRVFDLSVGLFRRPPLRLSPKLCFKSKW